MPRKRESPVAVTDEELLKHANVPVYLAAQSIGWSSCTLHYALQEGRAPFGFASCHENEEGKIVWAYNISPKLLIAYREGKLASIGLKELVKTLTGEVEALFGGDKLTKIILRGIMETMGKLDC